MKGTFKPGDKLIIEKILFNQVKIGDLIIFSRTNRDENDFVVHRVMGKSPGGLTTRGDNCREKDLESVIEENIIGKVIKYDRKGKIRKAGNGGLGRLNARTLHGRLNLIKATKFFLRAPYIKIRESGIIARLWRPEIETIHFETPDGPLIKYIHKGRTVVMCWINKNRWWCRRPYDLIVGTKTNK